MKRKKIIFLILALLLPGTIFVFLKLFGRNEFQVPVLHEKSVPDVSDHCDFAYSTPYRMPDSILTSVDPRRNDSVYVFNFDRRVDEAMQRISEEFRDHPVRVITTSRFPSGFDPAILRECVFLMRGDTSVVVVDNSNRIRGYYYASDRDEVDRMIVEIKIILKQY